MNLGGVLLEHDRTRHRGDFDLWGHIVIGGVEFRLYGWWNEGTHGARYLKLRATQRADR